MNEAGQLLGTIPVGEYSINVYQNGITLTHNGNIITIDILSEEVVNSIMKLIFAEGYSCVQGRLAKVAEPFMGIVATKLPYPIELHKSGYTLESVEDVDLYIGYYGITGELEEATIGVNAPRGTNWYNTLKLLGKK